MTCAVWRSLAERCRHSPVCLRCLEHVEGSVCRGSYACAVRWSRLLYVTFTDGSWFMPRPVFLFLVLLSPKTCSEVAVLP